MKYAYVQGWYGNGFEDAGSDVSMVKLFESKSQALAFSGEQFVKESGRWIDDIEANDISVYEIAEQLNGEVDVAEGCWEIAPESTLYGRVVEIV